MNQTPFKVWLLLGRRYKNCAPTKGSFSHPRAHHASPNYQSSHPIFLERTPRKHLFGSPQPTALNSIFWFISNVKAPRGSAHTRNFVTFRRGGCDKKVSDAPGSPPVCTQNINDPSYLMWQPPSKRKRESHCIDGPLSYHVLILYHTRALSQHPPSARSLFVCMHLNVLMYCVLRLAPPMTESSLTHTQEHTLLHIYGYSIAFDDLIIHKMLFDLMGYWLITWSMTPERRYALLHSLCKLYAISLDEIKTQYYSYYSVNSHFAVELQMEICICPSNQYSVLSDVMPNISEVCMSMCHNIKIYIKNSNRNGTLCLR